MKPVDKEATGQKKMEIYDKSQEKIGQLYNTSLGALLEIASFLGYRDLMTIQFCGRKFYLQVVPVVMTRQNMSVKIGLYYHLFRGYEYEVQAIENQLSIEEELEAFSCSNCRNGLRFPRPGRS